MARIIEGDQIEANTKLPHWNIVSVLENKDIFILSNQLLATNFISKNNTSYKPL